MNFFTAMWKISLNFVCHKSNQMSDTTIIILLTIGILLAIILATYQEQKIKKLQKKNALLKKELEHLTSAKSAQSTR